MQTLDFRMSRCPLPLIKTKLWLKEADIGSRARILLSDPGSWLDIPKYLTDTGQQVISIEQTDTGMLIEVCKQTHNLAIKL